MYTSEIDRPQRFEISKRFSPCFLSFRMVSPTSCSIILSSRQSKSFSALFRLFRQ